LRAIRDLVKAKEDTKVMYVRTDDGPVEGILSTDGYIDANTHTPPIVAGLIIERLVLRTAR